MSYPNHRHKNGQTGVKTWLPGGGNNYHTYRKSQGVGKVSLRYKKNNIDCHNISVVTRKAQGRPSTSQGLSGTVVALHLWRHHGNTWCLIRSPKVANIRAFVLKQWPHKWRVTTFKPRRCGPAVLGTFLLSVVYFSTKPLIHDHHTDWATSKILSTSRCLRECNGFESCLVFGTFENSANMSYEQFRCDELSTEL